MFYWVLFFAGGFFAVRAIRSQFNVTSLTLYKYATAGSAVDPLMAQGAGGSLPKDRPTAGVKTGDYVKRDIQANL